jgi:hypothetical protein
MFADNNPIDDLRSEEKAAQSARLRNKQGAAVSGRKATLEVLPRMFSASAMWATNFLFILRARWELKEILERSQVFQHDCEEAG